MSLGTLFFTILYQPLYNALIFLYNFLGKDIGVAIIALTVLIKLILVYPSLAQLKAQRKLQETQPKLKELKEKFKDDKAAYNQAVLAFYKENKVNPMSSCLPLLIQLPILIALYQVFIAGLVTDTGTGLIAAEQLKNLYEPLRVIYNHTPLHTMFLGFVDMAKKGNIILAVLAGATTFWQSKMLTVSTPKPKGGTASRDENMTAALNRNMLYLLPLMTLFFSWSFPAGLALYWLVSTLFQIGQQYYFLRRHGNTPPTTAPTAIASQEPKPVITP